MAAEPRNVTDVISSISDSEGKFTKLQKELHYLKKQLEKKNAETSTYKKLTPEQINQLKQLVKQKIFRQFKYIDSGIWKNGELHRKTMDKLGLKNLTGQAKYACKKDVEKEIKYVLAQYRHSRVNALCSMYCKGKIGNLL